MAPLTIASRALARGVSRSTTCLNAARSFSMSTQLHDSGSYSSPFKVDESKTTKIPDFSHYASKGGANTGLLFQYFMVGAMGAITAAGAKSTVQGASSNVLDSVPYRSIVKRAHP
jgi:ubiquinol-cytochrome c reductase iron-sulfur subunit